MNDRDWTLVNAYADGELDASEVAVLTARLANEPALASDLRDIRSLKGRLALLRPLQAPPAISSGVVRFLSARAAFRPMALAALLAFAALVGFAWLERPASMDTMQPADVAALHSSFSDHSYDGSIVGDLADTPGSVPPPDLSGSNLRLVDMRSFGRPGAEAIGYHYRGPRGCRVTLAMGPDLELPTAINLAHWWTIGTRTLVLVADGMDPQRFAAIAAYAEAATRDRGPAERLRIALEERTAAARPCA